MDAFLGAAALLVGGASCSDDSIAGLGDTFDPEAALAVVENLAAADEENVSAAHVPLAADVLIEAASAEAAIGSRHEERLKRLVRGFAGESRADAPTLASVMRAPGLSLSIARAEARRAATAGGAGNLMPEEFLGATFGFRDSGGYTRLPEREGAPADGVRFLTYELDPVTRRPRRIPLEERGRLDISEVPSAGFPRLELRGGRGRGSNDTPELDLFLEGSFSLTETEFSSEFVGGGEILDGKRRVQFAVDERLALTDRLEISLGRRIEVPDIERLVLVEWEGIVTAESATVTLRLDLSDNGHALTLEVLFTDITASGSVVFDGQTVALIGGNPFQPDFTRPDGGFFSDPEEEALMGLLIGSDEVLVFGDQMFASLVGLFAS